MTFSVWVFNNTQYSILQCKKINIFQSRKSSDVLLIPVIIRCEPACSIRWPFPKCAVAIINPISCTCVGSVLRSQDACCEKDLLKTHVQLVRYNQHKMTCWFRFRAFAEVYCHFKCGVTKCRNVAQHNSAATQTTSSLILDQLKQTFCSARL